MTRNFSRLFLTLATLGLCATLPAAEREASVGEWKFISNKDGVALYRRQRPASNESKAIGEIAAPTALVHAVIDDVESYASFMPYTAECRVLKRDGESVVAYQRISAPLTSDRDYTVRVRSSSKRRTRVGKCTKAIGKPENALGLRRNPPVRRVRAGNYARRQGWLLEPTGPNTTRAIYLIYTDSGGMIPTFIKNTGSQIGIRKLLRRNPETKVSDPQYAKKN